MQRAKTKKTFTWRKAVYFKMMIILRAIKSPCRQDTRRRQQGT